MEEEVEYISDDEVVMGEQEESNHGYTQNIQHFEEKDDVDEWMKDGIMKRQSEASTGSISDEVSSITSNEVDKDDNNTSNTRTPSATRRTKPKKISSPFNIITIVFMLSPH
ncbi:hypothetical protein Tco_0340637 [Tanacetum coccineum]